MTDEPFCSSNYRPPLPGSCATSILRVQAIEHANILRASSSGHDSIYALDSEADLYFLAGRRAAFPYLWAHPLEEIPGAMRRLRVLLGGDHHPRLVVVFRAPALVDRSGGLARILREDYRLRERIPAARAAIFRSSPA